jgi:hypothetical protein
MVAEVLEATNTFFFAVAEVVPEHFEVFSKPLMLVPVPSRASGTVKFLMVAEAPENS